MSEKAEVGSVLTLDGWLEFNRYKWGVTPLKVRLTENSKDIPAIEAVLYLDKKGHIVQPPLNPYLPVIFHPTPTDKRPRLYRQWLSLSGLLVEEFLKRGVKGSVAFPPEVVDVRQWQWYGFVAEVRYTFYIELPYDLEAAYESKRTKIRKAQRNCFYCEIATKRDLPQAAECLKSTAEIKKFNIPLTARDLEVAYELLGDNNLRIYVCRESSGKIISANLIVRAPNAIPRGWLAGTLSDFRSTGAYELLYLYSLNDLASFGHTVYDFCGANIPSVSLSKSEWGGKLVPYYLLRPLNLRTLCSYGIKFFKGKIKKKSYDSTNFN